MIRNLCLIAISLGLQVGCSTVGYYGQAIRGHLEIMHKAKPVREVLAQPATTPALRKRLEATQDMLDFAVKELDLPAAAQYRRYADLGRTSVSWVICAAPEFSTKPKEWWFPVVGKLPYKGYFSEEEARREAEKLRAEGLDVLVGEVNAYSTLGWFHDPLLNTFINESEPFLAELLYHELTHQRLYLEGKAEFNEALANAVGRQGTRRWLKARGKLTLLAKYDASLKALDVLHTQLAKCDASLAKLYAETENQPAWPPARRRAAKEAIFQELRNACQAHPVLRERAGVRRWLSQPLSNAHLALHQTYHALIEPLEAQLEACGRNFAEFFRSAEAKERRRQ